MRETFCFATIASLLGLTLLTALPFPAPTAPKNRVLPPPQSRRTIRADANEKKEPTFEETRDFILRHTCQEREDTPGEHHTYLLDFSNRRLKLTHKYLSRFAPSYIEKIAVDLSDLDPAKVEIGETAFHVLSLGTTNNTAKISVESRSLLAVEPSDTEKSTLSKMDVPSSSEESNEAQGKMEERLKKAWIHLIRLAGGKTSKDEPF